VLLTNTPHFNPSQRPVAGSLLDFTYPGSARPGVELTLTAC